ncbi:MAG: beta-lactamase [Caulobacteraceae bacterium]|nr:beta-lactamase [Caulobacteraceae bacterium]
MTLPRISAAESQVMEVLWREAPQAAEQVAAALTPHQDWTEGTVKTLLRRLMAKGAISAAADGRRYLYSPVLQRAAYVAAESETMVDRLFGGRLGPLMLQFADRARLNAQDVEDIRRLLAEIDTDSATKGDKP